MCFCTVFLQAITAKDGAALGRNVLRFAHGETCQVCGSADSLALLLVAHGGRQF